MGKQTWNNPGDADPHGQGGGGVGCQGCQGHGSHNPVGMHAAGAEDQQEESQTEEDDGHEGHFGEAECPPAQPCILGQRPAVVPKARTCRQQRRALWGDKGLQTAGRFQLSEHSSVIHWRQLGDLTFYEL